MLRLLVIVAIASVAVSITTIGTLAFFQDTETVSGNEFRAGTVDITVDGNNGLAGNGGVVCLGLEPLSFKGTSPDIPTDCALKPSQFGHIKFLLDNVGDNPVDVWKRIATAVSTNNGWSEPECETVASSTYVPPTSAIPADCTVIGTGGVAVSAPSIDDLENYMDFDLAAVDAFRVPTDGSFTTAGNPAVGTPALQIVDRQTCEITGGIFDLGLDGVEAPPFSTSDDSCLFPQPPREIVTEILALPLNGVTPGGLDSLIGCEMYLGTIQPGGAMTVIQSFHLQDTLDNHGQTDIMSFDEVYTAMQVNNPMPSSQECLDFRLRKPVTP
jgi:predicted ribosomally synthesized peptide with SipW-like signal peptide